MVFRQRNSQRFYMDMSAAEVKRAASAQPSPESPAADPNGSEILVKCLQAEGVSRDQVINHILSQVAVP